MKQFIVAIFIAAGLSAFAIILHLSRPPIDTASKISKSEVRATGKCAECHSHQTPGIVHHFEKSRHITVGVTCLDCHKVAENQSGMDHKGFKITEKVTSKNCAECHADQYRQFERSRHAAPSWAAVHGNKDFTEEQIENAEKWHKNAVNRPSNALAYLEGPSAIKSGCEGCHAIGRPNKDGSIGQCTECHSKHNPSLSLARQPHTCGQCHMGPDHSQLEIYTESKHGAIFSAEKHTYNLNVSSKDLTTKDMPTPTCATCHMSGIEGNKMTHDVSTRLSYWLFAPVSHKRPGAETARNEMKEICLSCHTKDRINAFYDAGDKVVEDTNAKVLKAQKIISDLKKDGFLVNDPPFSKEIQFLEFDLWHYFGRTAKHGAFMGGADFVQWHGNYELLHKLVELEGKANELREKHKK